MPGNQGTAEIDFGAFPGASDALLTLSGASFVGITTAALVEAYLYPKATVDHSADEHMVETILVMALPETIVDDTGFQVFARNTSEIFEPLELFKGSGNRTIAGSLLQPNNFALPRRGGRGTRIYGKWTIAWVWNL